MITFVIATTLSCGAHVAVKWGNLEGENQQCGMDLGIDNALVISDAVTNLLIWLMPMPMVWGLHLTWRSKLALVGILMTGSMCVHLRFAIRPIYTEDHSSVVASIIKIIISFEIAGGGLAANVDEDCEFFLLLSRVHNYIRPC